MKIGTGLAFIMALAFHGLLLGALVVNVSLERPKRPEDKTGQIMHATIVNIPPAKGSPSGKPPAPAKPTPPQPTSSEEILKKTQELEKIVEAQKKAEVARQKAIALKKAQEKKKAEEEKRKLEEAKKKAEEQRKAEEKRKAEEEAKKKAEEEKRKAEEAKKKAEEQRKAEEKRKAEEERRRAEAARIEAEQLAQLEQANNLEQDLLGQVNGVQGGVGLGSGTGSNDSQVYGVKVQQLIEQNWRIDPSMNGKRVIVTLTLDENGLITSQNCEGDRNVCASASSTINLIGMFPRPPQQCKDCNTIVITMTPKI